MAGHRVPSERNQHLAFLAHVWACAPFMIPWTRDPMVHAKLGDPTIALLRPFVVAILAYLLGRTWLAWRSPSWLRWHYVFPPLDVLVISLLIAVSHRGPLSTLTLLYFFPIIQAAGSLNVVWAAFVSVLVVAGTGVSTIRPPSPLPPGIVDPATQGLVQLVQTDLLNVTFRVWFMIVLASLMTYQARIAAEYRAEARMAEDRNRIALDVHDGVQGSLIAVASSLELISRVAETERVADLARDARTSARDAADELRFLVQRLRPPSLTGGFLPAMRQYAHALAGRHDLELAFEVEGEPRALPPEAEQAVFHMAQEALNNVAKHACARRVAVRLVFGKGSLAFAVEDDGCGLGDAPEGTGRAGMRERAVAQGGTFEVEAGPLGGTRVRAEIPA